MGVNVLKNDKVITPGKQIVVKYYHGNLSVDTYDYSYVKMIALVWS